MARRAGTPGLANSSPRDCLIPFSKWKIIMFSLDLIGPHAKRQTKAGISVLDVPVRWLAVLRIALHFFLLASRTPFV